MGMPANRIALPLGQNEVCGRGKGGWVANVVEVVVRPNYGFNIRTPNCGFVLAYTVRMGIQDFRHILFGVALGRLPNQINHLGSIVVPIASDAEVEENVAVSMGDEEAIYRHVDAVEPFQFGPPK